MLCFFASRRTTMTRANTHQNTRNDTCCEHIGNGYAGDGCINNECNTRWYDDGESNSTSPSGPWKTEQKNPPCSIMAGIRTMPKCCYGCRTGTGNRAKEAGYDNAYDRDTALLWPTQVSTKRISRLEMPAFAIMFPDSTKNGIARSKNLLIPEYILVATMVRDVPEYRIAQIEDRPRQMPIGIPRIKKTKNERKELH